MIPFLSLQKAVESVNRNKYRKIIITFAPFSLTGYDKGSIFGIKAEI